MHGPGAGGAKAAGLTRQGHDDHGEGEQDQPFEMVVQRAEQPSGTRADLFDQRLAQTVGIARAKGFLLVASSPLTRSSYHAGDDFERLRANREARLAKTTG